MPENVISPHPSIVGRGDRAGGGGGDAGGGARRFRIQEYL